MLNLLCLLINKLQRMIVETILKRSAHLQKNTSISYKIPKYQIQAIKAQEQPSVIFTIHLLTHSLSYPKQARLPKKRSQALMKKMNNLVISKSLRSSNSLMKRLQQSRQMQSKVCLPLIPTQCQLPNKPKSDSYIPQYQIQPKQAVLIL